jgi:hypothetical protein
MNQEELQKTYDELVIKARENIDLWDKLSNKPNKVLKENGVDVPKEIKLATIVNWPSKSFKILPNTPEVNNDETKKWFDMFEKLTHLDPI